MNLVLYSNKSIEEMKNLVINSFSDVPKREVGLISYASETPAFTPKELSRLEKVKTITKKRNLVFKFLLPSYLKEFHSKPLDILAYYVGHEGKGSILSLLLKKKYALNLSTYDINYNDYFTVYLVEIELTEEGLQNYEEIVLIFFGYIKTLLQSGLTQEMFEEIQNMKKLSFLFRSKIDHVKKVIEVAENLKDFPPRFVNNVRFLLDDYNPGQFGELLGQIIPENMIICLLNHDFENLSSTDPFFETKYSDEPISQELIGKIKSILEGSISSKIILTKILCDDLEQKFFMKIYNIILQKNAKYILTYQKPETTSTKTCSFPKKMISFQATSK